MKILYVDKNYDGIYSGVILETIGQFRRSVISRLMTRFEVDFASDFDFRTIGLLTRETDPFDALLTHFPYTEIEGRMSYQVSIGNMRSIRQQFPNLAIVIYTGAHPKQLPMGEVDIKDIIFRTQDPERDAASIISALERLLGE